MIPDPAAPLLCEECGHATYWHRNTGTPVNNIGPDDPVPCAAAVSARETPRRGTNAVSYEYEFCRCTAKHTLAMDAARRRKQEATR